jgi:Pyrimidine dimer DNA glycosylase
MQTFIPETLYADCAEVLDRQRLGKQRVECLQIMNVLCGVATKSGWSNHPAVTMWRGWEYGLMMYGQAICDEWTGRGYMDTCSKKIRESFYYKHGSIPFEMTMYPDWWYDLSVHRSHQSNLLRKDYNHYSVFYSDVPDDLEYVWPPGRYAVLDVRYR